MRKGRVVTVALAVVGAVALVLAGAVWLADEKTMGKIEELAERFSLPAGSESALTWADLYAINPDICAWLTVEGTEIDMCVVQADSSDPDHYLSYDLWGSSSGTGWPYLDYRCEATGRVLVVYGHNTGTSGLMFNDLSLCFQEEEFSKLSCATWETEGMGETTYTVLCSSKVDADSMTWKRYVVTGVSDLREWLAEGVSEADMVSDDADALVASATRVLILATCSGRWLYGSYARTVTVFVSCT